MPLLPDPLAHDCRTGYNAYHFEGERLPSRIRYIVLHSTEGGSAKSVAEYFTEPGSGGSANIVVDDFACYRCLGDNVIPWGAPPLNTNGFHIEQCGYAAWSRARWLLHRNTIRRAAYKAALRMKWYNIPARILNVEELIADYYLPADLLTPSAANVGPMRGGIVTHATISAAYHESTHTDPGSGYPLDVFLDDVTGFLS